MSLFLSLFFSSTTLFFLHSQATVYQTKQSESLNTSNNHPTQLCSCFIDILSCYIHVNCCHSPLLYYSALPAPGWKDGQSFTAILTD
uniref:Putative secreted protein n=1 Tax=Anopheles darlingi TaxID=43151 RepID=A0A2M4D7H0_ANODA